MATHPRSRTPHKPVECWQFPTKKRGISMLPEIGVARHSGQKLPAFILHLQLRKGHQLIRVSHHVLRGSSGQVSHHFFGIEKNWPKLHVSVTFLVQTCTSNLPPPPSQWCSNPPPLVYMKDPLLCMGINKKVDIVACCLPRGVPLRWPIFKFWPPGGALACKLIKIINHGFLCLHLNIILSRGKSQGKTPSSRQILTPTPFRRRLHVGVCVWARAPSAHVPLAH